MCKYGHQFKTSPGVHLREDSCGGCKECQAHATSLRNSYSEEQWIELALSKHDNYYSYARTIYKGSGIKVIITCPHHGDFEQDPISHLSGCGCPVCGIKRSATAKILSEQDERDIFAKSHQLHANRYEYLRLFRVEGRLYIEMICPRHDIISQRLDHHIHGHGCMQCTPQYSKLQMEILKYYAVSRYPSMLHAENGGEYKIPGTRYKADGFHSETNTVVEIHGDFWHGGDEYNPLEVNPRTGTTYGSLREKTKRKEEEIKKLGHNLISIWGTEWFRGQQAITILQKLWRKKALTPAPAAPPGTP
jgi:G:T-mismatch repair DNA endonuclease (very short patch repair protein)